MRRVFSTPHIDPNWPGPDNLYGYTGLGYDYTSGLTYARARYYQPEIGRFISEDTYKGSLWNPKTQNNYAYVGNNPLLYIDPTGHYWTVDLALPLTQDDKDIITAAEAEYANAIDDEGRSIAHQKAMDVRNKYISQNNLRDAIKHLNYDGIINKNLDFASEICSDLTSVELIYAYAGTLIKSNSDNYIYAFGGGNTIEDGLERFYGEIVCFTGDNISINKRWPETN